MYSEKEILNALEKKTRKPRFEKSCMSGTIKDCQRLYDEVKQWNKLDELDTSTLKGIVYGLGWSQGDLAYHGWGGDALKRESNAIEAVISACKYLQNVLEDVLGIPSEDYVDYLKNDEHGRYKLIDTYY